MKYKNSEGNEKLIERLQNAIVSKRISHAYLFEGLKDDRIEFGKAFMKAIFCPDNRGENCGLCSICSKFDHDNFEDLLYIQKDGNSIKDAEILSMQEKLNVKPFGERHIVVIDDSDTMTLKAQNRLLKVLEEPPGNAVIILLTDNMEKLIQTILSRCVKFRINSTVSVNRKSAEKAEELVKMLLNREPFYRTKEFINNYLNDRDKAFRLLDNMEMAYRNLISTRNAEISLYKFEDIYENIYAVEEARSNLQKGYSVGYVMKKLLLVTGSR